MSVVQDHDCLVEGPLDNMQPSLMSFPPPLNRRTDQRRLYFTALSQGTHAGASSKVRSSTNSKLDSAERSYRLSCSRPLHDASPPLRVRLPQSVRNSAVVYRLL